MSRRNKLEKFADNLRFSNVYENFNPKEPGLLGENGLPVKMKGYWNEKHFRNDHPITLELACGRGEYSLGLAAMYPDRNFIGVDIKGARIWRGAKNAQDQQLENVAFLRTRIEQVHLFFEPGEVAEIWITFPDPFLSNSKVNRRLTAPRFLKTYRQILLPGGLVHLKTDSPELYEFSLETIGADPACTLLYQNDDIYQSERILPELDLKTYYERLHLQDKRTIKYLQFTI